MKYIKKDQFTDLNNQFFKIHGRAMDLAEECSDMAANVLADIDLDNYMSSLNACRLYYTAERVVYGSSIAFSGLHGPFWAQTNYLCQLEISHLKVWSEPLKSDSDDSLYWSRYDLAEEGSQNKLKEVYDREDLQDSWDRIFLRAAVMRRLAADIGERLVLRGKAYRNEVDPFFTEANRSKEAKDWYTSGPHFDFKEIVVPMPDGGEKKYVITRPSDRNGFYTAYQLARRCYTGPDQVGALEAIRWAILDEMFVFDSDGKEVSALEYDRLKVPMGKYALQEAKKTVSAIMSEEYDPLD